MARTANQLAVLHYHPPPLHRQLGHPQQMEPIETGKVGVAMLTIHKMGFGRVPDHQIALGPAMPVDKFVLGAVLVEKIQ